MLHISFRLIFLFSHMAGGWLEQRLTLRLSMKYIRLDGYIKLKENISIANVNLKGLTSY